MRNAMKYSIGASAIALTLVMGYSANAACPDEINKLRTDLQANQSFAQRYSAGKIDRASYTRLFEAADTFAKAGLEKRCQDVLAGIKELSEKVEAEASPSPRPSPNRY